MYKNPANQVGKQGFRFPEKRADSSEASEGKPTGFLLFLRPPSFNYYLAMHRIWNLILYFVAVIPYVHLPAGGCWI